MNNYDKRNQTVSMNPFRSISSRRRSSLLAKIYPTNESNRIVRAEPPFEDVDDIFDKMLIITKDYVEFHVRMSLISRSSPYLRTAISSAAMLKCIPVTSAPGIAGKIQKRAVDIGCIVKSEDGMFFTVCLDSKTLDALLRYVYCVDDLLPPYVIENESGTISIPRLLRILDVQEAAVLMGFNEVAETLKSTASLCLEELDLTNAGESIAEQAYIIASWLELNDSVREAAYASLRVADGAEDLTCFRTDVSIRRRFVLYRRTCANAVLKLFELTDAHKYPIGLPHDLAHLVVCPECSGIRGTNRKRLGAAKWWQHFAYIAPRIFTSAPLSDAVLAKNELPNWCFDRVMSCPRCRNVVFKDYARNILPALKHEMERICSEVELDFRASEGWSFEERRVLMKFKSDR